VISTTKALAAIVMTGAMMGTAAVSAQAWVNPGSNTQYPSTGGTWQYGFWDVKIRSYYTVNKCHGSTVVKYINGSETARSRSADTASNAKSIAEVNTLNSSGLEARYYYRTC
jgi:hypothetical protein